jgi:hypothetical protein
MLRKQLPEREDVAMLSSPVASCGTLNRAERFLNCLSLRACDCAVPWMQYLLRCKPTSTPLALHQLALLLPKGVRMLPPTLLLPSPKLPVSVCKTEQHGDRSCGGNKIGAGSDNSAGQLLARQPNVLYAQENLGEALAQELGEARALWEPTSEMPAGDGRTLLQDGADLVAARRTAAMRSDMAAAKLLAAAAAVWPDYGRNQSVDGRTSESGS